MAYYSMGQYFCREFHGDFHHHSKARLFVPTSQCIQSDTLVLPLYSALCAYQQEPTGGCLLLLPLESGVFLIVTIVLRYRSHLQYN